MVTQNAEVTKDTGQSSLAQVLDTDSEVDAALAALAEGGATAQEGSDAAAKGEPDARVEAEVQRRLTQAGRDFQKVSKEKVELEGRLTELEQRQGTVVKQLQSQLEMLEDERAKGLPPDLQKLQKDLRGLRAENAQLRADLDGVVKAKSKAESTLTDLQQKQVATEVAIGAGLSPATLEPYRMLAREALVNLAKQIKGTGASPEVKGVRGDSLTNTGAVGAITAEMMKRANSDFGSGKMNEKTYRAIKARYDSQVARSER